MKVAPNQPFKIIYAILSHEYLGYIFESFVVQLNAQGEYTYQVQNISSKNVKEFKSAIDNTDYELVKLIDDIQQDYILKKFNPKKLSAVDFFLKVYDPQKGDKMLQEAIAENLDRKKKGILERLAGKELFIMGSDGNPLWKKVIWEEEPAKIRFHFVRNDDNTHYFPSILHNGKKLEFQYKNAIVLCEEKAWIEVDGHLYHFQGEVDGKKIKPFLAKNFIAIPRSVEEQYYRKFISPLIASYDVVARGFDIKTVEPTPRPTLTITDLVATGKLAPALFGEDPVGDEELTSTNNDVVIELSFRYGSHTFPLDDFAHASSVYMEKQGDEYTFFKVGRDLAVEKQKHQYLQERGLKLKNGKIKLTKTAAFGWLQRHIQDLNEARFSIKQNASDTKRYFLGYSSLDISIQENRDWFDIHAKVIFGDYEISFLELRQYILHEKHEFTLPNGEVAVIPDWWFTKYSELFSFSENGREDHQLRLKMHHMALVQELSDDNLATTVMSRRLEGLKQFDKIAPQPIPQRFNGTLRPYQKAGYDWMSFLNQFRLGGCLADDMGLGKTVQTLALLQAQKETGHTEPSLLIMPTSLLYNWSLEASKFTPDLKVLLYTGTYREKDTSRFSDYDLIITSYGIVRLDIALLQSFRFHYIILDESQAIKNPGSIITKAVKKLNSAHRLILTGTPVENSTMDLWSQMSFVNPGLLGTQRFFKDEFQIPIEKKNDEEKSKRLYNLIKPFILRRNKVQVATDLPEKVEQITYSEMSPEQEKAYEEAKAYYRNQILEQIERDGMGKSQLTVLQGLSQLRQLANHPKMVQPEYDDRSGKFEDVLHKIETVISEDHKILVFSQYIKHLNLFREVLDKNHIKYAYLDGSTKDRQQQVEDFQNKPELKLFLISLKAGGLGLNLTAADYVFILDPWWNPAIEAQAVDRAHRIGQDRTVFTYKFITKNTVEEKILALQKSKKQLADGLISSEDGFMKSLTKEDVLNLLA
ncbi:helicase-like protein [Dyadobacter jejuensis]|uniref:Helicase-like protein n=1 Tax=Dyadobacter jejuensis TaxID=1082580 RepID=A0A316BD09_9BACT|nr:DEAD/DEAH box helicase [Dyadobacter jejuensis]PWJ60357.1 helicase-like protein [Dyadobacter jejuensis]